MDAAEAIQVIETLAPDKIEARLAELRREEQALRVLLRSARARQRGRKPGQESGREAKPCKN